MCPDLPYIQQRQEISITGQDSTGDQVNYVGADANGNLAVKDYADGPVTPGTVASASILTGGQYNSTLPTLTSGQQAAVQLDSSGRLVTDVGLSVAPSDVTVSGTLTSGSSVVTINLNSAASLNVDVSGSGFVGTIMVQVVEPSSARSLPLFNLSSSLYTANITTNGSYRVASLPGSGQVNVLFTSYTSGSANILLRSSIAPYYVQPFNLNAANVLVTSYLNDGSGNAINSSLNALNVNTKTPLIYSAPTTASVGTTSTLILNANTARVGLILSNTTSQQISLGFNGNAAAYQNGLTLFPGEKFWMDEYSFSTGAIYAITTGTATYIGIQEIT